MRRFSHALVLLVLACDGQAGGSAVTPGGVGGDSELRPEGEPGGESMNELDQRLDKLVEKRSNLVGAGSEDPKKCKDLCELQRAICEIKTKMCDIAEDRVTDDEYQNLCRKAKQRCSDAEESCVECVERNIGGGATTCEGQ